MEEKQIVEDKMVVNEMEAKRYKEGNLKIRKIVYYLLGILEVLFAFRFVFKLLGAKEGSTFVAMIYTVSGIFMAPFNGIFGTVQNQGGEIKSVLEFTIIIAMVVYALIAYGIVRLLEIYQTPRNNGAE